MVIVILVFAVGCVICGAAHSINMLIGGRGSDSLCQVPGLTFFKWCRALAVPVF